MNNHRKKTLLLALAIDIILGDPPNRFHPVVWMGDLLKFLQRGRPYGNSRKELLYGAGMVAVAGGIVAFLGKMLEKTLFSLPKLLSILAEALFLKLTFALRSLDRAAGEVQSALEDEDLPEARRLLSWHLVSRNTENLTEAEISAAAIESVAENASDGLIAPTFYYLLGGIPMALAYRLFNTADSLYGYRTPELEWFGKIPAYVDDLLNFIPARLTAFLIVIASPFGERLPKFLKFRKSFSKTVQITLRDAKKTESPNAGYPMSALAGALGVELSKDGHYSLGGNQAQPTLASLSKSRKILFGLAGVGVAIALLIPASNKKIHEVTQRNTKF